MAGANWTVMIEGLRSGVLYATMHCQRAEAGSPPGLALVIGDDPTHHGVICTQEDGRDVKISAEVPPAALNTGLAILTLIDVETHLPMANYPLRAGSDVDRDLAAEVALLRAEVQALRRAFLIDAGDPKLRAVEKPLIVAEALERALEAMQAAPGRQDTPAEPIEPSGETP